jgi:hypothetical protein
MRDGSVISDFMRMRTWSTLEDYTVKTYYLMHSILGYIFLYTETEGNPGEATETFTEQGPYSAIVGIEISKVCLNHMQDDDILMHTITLPSSWVAYRNGVDVSAAIVAAINIPANGVLGIVFSPDSLI